MKIYIFPILQYLNCYPSDKEDFEDVLGHEAIYFLHQDMQDISDGFSNDIEGFEQDQIQACIKTVKDAIEDAIAVYMEDIEDMPMSLWFDDEIVICSAEKGSIKIYTKVVTTQSPDELYILQKKVTNSLSQLAKSMKVRLDKLKGIIILPYIDLIAKDVPISIIDSEWLEDWDDGDDYGDLYHPI